MPNKCSECDTEIKVHVKLCMKCIEELKNDKYEDFAIVMASLNNTMHDLLKNNENLEKDNENLKKQVQDLLKEKELLQLSKIVEVNNS